MLKKLLESGGKGIIATCILCGGCALATAYFDKNKKRRRRAQFDKDGVVRIGSDEYVIADKNTEEKPGE